MQGVTTALTQCIESRSIKTRRETVVIATVRIHAAKHRATLRQTTELLASTGKASENEGNGVTYADFGNGKKLFWFAVSPDLC